MLEFIAILVLIFLGLRIIIPLVLPILVKKYLENFRKKFHQNNPPSAERGSSKGSRVNINSSRKKTKNESDNLGEYTDFEEIKDK